MIGILMSVVVNFCAIFVHKHNTSDAFLITMAFLVGFYIFCLIAGAIARLIASRGDAEQKSVNSMLNVIGRSWSAYILTQSWREFIACEMLFIGAASLLFGSGHFGENLAQFNPYMFFGGLLMLLAAVITQRIYIRAFKEKN